MNFLVNFNEDITNYLSRSHFSAGSSSSLKLIKFLESGAFDFSFPISLKIWRNYLNDLSEDDIEKFQDNILLLPIQDTSEHVNENFKNASSRLNWTFAIESVDVKDIRCNFTINRVSSYAKLLNEITNGSNYGACQKNDCETVSIEVDEDYDGDSSITQHRVEIIAKIVRNLVGYSKFILVGDSSIAKHKILVTSKSNLCKQHSQTNRTLLTCGAVLSPSEKKISHLSSNDYIEKRCEDMHLISIHKYGVRVENDEDFKKLIQQLGQYATILDLLEVKQSSAVTLTPDPKKAFILYNSARMETLMEKFNKKVDEGYYPEVNDIDLSLLKEDEEWQLLKLLILFPDVIDRSINELHQGKVSLHLIHKYLSDLVSTFSIYYRRVRLLTENRAQLMKVLHTKIYFLRAVRKILNETLAIFCIEPIASM